MLNKMNFAIGKAASEDDESPLALKGLYVSPERTMATDGGIALIVSASTSGEDPGLFDLPEDVELADFFTPFILPRETAAKVAKAIPSKKKGSPSSQFAIVDATTEHNDRAMVSVNDDRAQDVLRAKKLDATFPDVLKLIPDKQKARLSIHMDPHRLLLLAKLLEEFSRFNDVPTVELTWYGEGHFLRFDMSASNQELIGLMATQRSEEHA